MTHILKQRMYDPGSTEPYSETETRQPGCAKVARVHRLRRLAGQGKPYEIDDANVVSIIDHYLGDKTVPDFAIRTELEWVDCDD